MQLIDKGRSAGYQSDQMILLGIERQDSAAADRHLHAACTQCHVSRRGELGYALHRRPLGPRL